MPALQIRSPKSWDKILFAPDMSFSNAALDSEIARERDRFKRNNDASNETKTLHQYNTSIVQTLLLLNPSCHRPSDKQSVRQLSLVTFSVLCEFFPQPFHAFVTPLPSNQLCSLHSRQIQRYKYKSRCYAIVAIADIFECGIFVVVIIAFVRIDF
ncbi:hypothetical protein T03_10770 [Trichinella britovi]|uniref:Uncharacterized protein n=1 Tax=Trichinella britovi TaxID=45882 RepID=A0A0V1C3W4_TRIBR|nr:hypothetical protein T03_10770 [Trichinella britovi]